MKKVYQVLAVVLSIVLIFFQVGVDLFYRFQLAYSIFVVTIFFSLVASFIYIFTLMHKYHNFEFRKNRKSMIIYMLSVTLAASVDCFILYVDSLVSDFNSMNSYVFACYTAETYGPALNLQFTTLFVPVTNPGYLLCAISLIIYKKTDDIL